MPNIEKERIIGIRVPVLRKYAKELAHGSRLFLSVQKEKRVCNTIKENDCDNVEKFLNTLPHYYYEENNLHMFLIMQMKDYDTALAYLEAFLPYIDNWATCDLVRVPAFRCYLPAVLERIRGWVASEPEYAVRFGVVQLMTLFLDDAFEPEHLMLVAGIDRPEYYINMARAWYFSFALVKQPAATLPLFEQRPIALDAWTHNKALQKARESRRVAAEQRAYLQSLKV